MAQDTKAGRQPEVKIGMVNYIDVAPISETWKERVNTPGWQVVEDVPAGINRRLLRGEIDVGFVSSVTCGLNPETLLLLPGLSFSASGPVGSVFLFSHVPFEQLDGERVLLTSQAATSAALVKLLLQEFFKVTPEYVVGEAADIGEDDDEDGVRAALAIGNDALRILETSDWLYQFDLADIWKRQTELPFVFGVFAARREFAAEHPQLLSEVHRELLRCQETGRKQLDRICERVASSIPMSRARCEEYLKTVKYKLTAHKREGLEHFFSLLVDHKMLPETALPLQFFTPDPE